MKQTFKLYADAVAHVCAGADIVFDATALSTRTMGHAHRLHAASTTIMLAYAPTYAEGTEYFAAMTAHRHAGGHIQYIEIDDHTHTLGYVAAWTDSEGDSVKYEAVRIVA